MRKNGKGAANALTNLFLKFFAANFNLRPSLRRYLKSDEGWLNFSIGVKTESGSVEQALSFENGKVRVLKTIPGTLDAEIEFVDEKSLGEAATAAPNRLMIAMMENRIVTSGNLCYPLLINFYLSLLFKPLQIAKLKREARSEKRNYDQDKASKKSIESRTLPQLSAQAVDAGVKFLTDPYLAEYTLNDFPRLKGFLDIHLGTRAAICHERPEILTRWYRENGFETDKNGDPWVPELRQAKAFKYLMENRKPTLLDLEKIMSDVKRFTADI